MNKQKDLRVAVFLYGQPRFLDNPYAYSSQKKYIFDRYDTDVFAHQWWSSKEKSYGYSKWEGGGTYHPFLDENRLQITDDAINIIKERYNPVRIKVEPSQTFSNEDLYNSITEAFQNEGRFTRHNLSTFFSQAQSIEKVTELYEEYLSEGGKPHDLIVMLRTDLNIQHYPDFRELDKSKYYISNHHNDFPDLAIIMGTKFLKSNKIYSYMMSKGCVNDVFKMPSAYGEMFKLFTFAKYFPTSDIVPIHLPCFVVRDNSETGANLNLT